MTYKEAVTAVFPGKLQPLNAHRALSEITLFHVWLLLKAAEMFMEKVDRLMAGHNKGHLKCCTNKHVHVCLFMCS